MNEWKQYQLPLDNFIFAALNYYLQILWSDSEAWKHMENGIGEKQTVKIFQFKRCNWNDHFFQFQTFQKKTFCSDRSF
jgi:hypothetical protein